MIELTPIGIGKRKTHKHHILPRHAGGTDDISNLIELTVEEHAEAHRLLWEEYGRWQDRLAWKALSGLIGKEEIQATASSAANKTRVRNPEEFEKGWETRRKNGKDKPSEESKNKTSRSLMGRSKAPFTDSHKSKIAERVKESFASGRQHTLPNLSGTVWWNNGTINKRYVEHPGPDWVRGRMNKDKSVYTPKRFKNA